MAGEYGIERAVILPQLPRIAELPLESYLRQEGEAIATAYDALARRINEFSYEQQWGSESPTQLTGNQNNYQLGIAIVERLTSDATRFITGFIAPLTENIRVITNVGSNNIVLANQSTSSLAPNRIITIAGTTVTLAPNDSVTLWYDITTARWREIHRLLSASIGNVTSVGLTMPGGFTVSNSPVTSAGTLAVTTTLDGILKADGTDVGVVAVGSGLSYDGTTLTTTSSGSGPVVVEHKLFTANATSYTFSGLDGNTDGNYLLICDLINNHAGAANYTIRWNNVTTDQQSHLRWFSYAGGNTSDSIGGADSTIGFSAAANTTAHMEIMISARKNPNSINRPLSYSGTGITVGGGATYSWTTGGYHNEFTNLTSLVLFSSQSDGLGDGSEAILWKLSQT